MTHQLKEDTENLAADWRQPSPFQLVDFWSIFQNLTKQNNISDIPSIQLIQALDSET